MVGYAANLTIGKHRIKYLGAGGFLVASKYYYFCVLVNVVLAWV